MMGGEQGTRGTEYCRPSSANGVVVSGEVIPLSAPDTTPHHRRGKS